MKHTKISLKSGLYALQGVTVLTAADQLTKYLAVHYLKNSSDIALLPGIFELSYLENRGAAWGIMKNMQWIFLILTVLALAAAAYFYMAAPAGRKYRSFRILCVVFSAGALGNALDRLFRGYVVDFFYLRLIHFPVFNVADCFVTISLVLLLILYRNEDFSWLKKSS
ncbi:MAG: signal peptidase II [Eubacteriales bacterium]|nr:signal peptidase II [Eubacteriales bacterium]